MKVQLTATARRIIQEAQKKEQHKRAAIFREAYYGVDKTEPCLSPVYKDRSFKAAMAFDLKVHGQDKKGHWCWKGK